MIRNKAHNKWECFAKTYEWNLKELGGESIVKKPPRFIFSPPANVTIIGGTAAY